jgi:hypothetical protein
MIGRTKIKEMNRPDPGHYQGPSAGRKHRGVSVPLTLDDVHNHETAAARIAVQGARYSEAAQRMIDR